MEFLLKSGKILEKPGFFARGLDPAKGENELKLWAKSVVIMKEGSKAVAFRISGSGFNERSDCCSICDYKGL